MDFEILFLTKGKLTVWNEFWNKKKFDEFIDGDFIIFNCRKKVVLVQNKIKKNSNKNKKDFAEEFPKKKEKK